MTDKTANFLSLLFSFVAIVSVLSQIVAFRPIQDDYFILGALSQLPISAIIQIVWESQGGNLLPYAVNSMLFATSLNSLNFIGPRVFVLLTAALVILVSLAFLKWSGLRCLQLKVIYIAISVLAFEGIFTPLQIAAYSWHQTSLAHLWPVALSVLAWSYAGRFRYSAITLGFMGLVVGNSNSAEALWSVMATALFVKTFLIQVDNKSRVKRVDLRIFILGCLFGLALTVMAPGFWNRASNSVGFPNSTTDLLHRFGKSTSAFTFDLLTHPFLWIALILGMFCKQHFDQMHLMRIPQIALFLGKSCTYLYVLLIVGTTIGYPAWHQALGLYIISLPLAFLVGVILAKSSERLSTRLLKTTLCVSLVICVVCSLRSSVLVLNRANSWDTAYRSNICSISQGKLDDLIGAELIYPIFRKGIEDIQTWSWMRQAYINWINSGAPHKSFSCNIKSSKSDHILE